MEWMKCMEWKRVHQTLIICHIIHLVIFFFFLLLRRCFRIRVVHLHESCIQRSAVNLIDYHAISFSLKSLIIVHHKNIATLFRITFWMWLLWAFRNDDSFADTSIFQGKVLLREKKKNNAKCNQSYKHTANYTQIMGRKRCCILDYGFEKESIAYSNQSFSCDFITIV